MIQKLWNFVGMLVLFSRSSGWNLRVIACMVFELYIFLLSLIETCVNFHNFSIGLVKVKFGECYSYARMILEKNVKSVAWHFSIGFPNYARNRPTIYYFWYSKFGLSNCFENFMVVYVKHEVATVTFVDFSVWFYYMLF